MTVEEAAKTWTPEQWILVITAVLGALGSMVTGVIAALRSGRSETASKQTQRDVTPPSNGITLGELAEGMAQVQHMMTGLMAELVNKPPPPAPFDVARQIKKDLAEQKSAGISPQIVDQHTAEKMDG